jgi:hypothetical protein
MSIRFEINPALGMSPETNFKKHPIFLTHDEAEKLRKRIRLNCAAGKLFGAWWFRYPVTSGASLFASHMLTPVLAGAIGSPFLAPLIVIAPIVIGGLSLFDALSRHFKDNVRRMGTEYEKNAVRHEAWRHYQNRLAQRIHRNVDETRRACVARDLAKEGKYEIPLIHRLESLSPGMAAASASLDGFLPTSGGLPKTAADWKEFHRAARIKTKLLKGIDEKKASNDGPLPPHALGRFLHGLAIHLTHA